MLGGQFAYLPIKIPLVYFAFYLLDVYFERKTKTFNLLAFLLLAFGIASIGMSFINHTIILPILKVESTISILNIGSLVYHFFNLLFVTGIACTLQLFNRQYESKLKEAELQKEKTETELKYLKGQINPHFLFNTLNNIYSLARKGSEQTATSILKLSQLMRFMLYEASHREIALQDEIKIIEDYIALEKLRYTDRLNVTFQYTLDNPQQHIAPLLLIHFVENAFKHGAGESRSSIDIFIHITLQDSLLTAEISNPLVAHETQPSELKIGMENIRRQLQLLYPLHQLEIEKTSHVFRVRLKIPLS